MKTSFHHRQVLLFAISLRRNPASQERKTLRLQKTTFEVRNLALVQTIQPYQPERKTKERVAAYCRVSTDSKDQLNSYHAQVAYYTELISDNPDWELADIYADEGITGTSCDKREEFKRMVADCREGKIQRVLVKSVSRFGRNTVELIETTRELTSLGVVVVFEEQHLDTSQMLGEMQLALLAVAAQEESVSISNNIRWSVQKRMQAGEFVGTYPPMGFDLSHGNLLPNEDAQTVKMIFALYASGLGMQRIADCLNEKNILTKSGKQWYRTSVACILNNEKYMGDALLQKRYTTETLPFREVKNRGERPQYYLRDHHPSIVSRTEFEVCHRIMAERGKVKQSLSLHLFTHRILCPDCGRHLRQLSCRGKSYWLCSNHIVYRYSEQTIMTAALNMLCKLYTHREEILSQPMKLLREIEFHSNGGDSRMMDLNTVLADLNEKQAALQRLNAKGYIDEGEYRLQNQQLASQRQKLTEERRKKLRGSQSHEVLEKLEQLENELDSWPGIPTEFDIAVFDRVVEKIIPADAETLTFKLHCGLALTEQVVKS